MPKKPVHPTVYPSMTRTDNVRAFATLVARAAIKECGNSRNQVNFEPDIKQYPMDAETSECYDENEMHSTSRFEEEGL